MIVLNSPHVLYAIELSEDAQEALQSLTMDDDDSDTSDQDELVYGTVNVDQARVRKERFITEQTYFGRPKRKCPCNCIVSTNFCFHCWLDMQLCILGTVEFARFMLLRYKLPLHLHRVSQNALEGLFGDLRSHVHGSLTAQQVADGLQRVRFARKNKAEFSFFNNTGQKK